MIHRREMAGAFGQPFAFDRGFGGHAVGFNAPALLLSRCLALAPEHLDDLTTKVIPAGVHIHANTDLPGQFNAYHKPNANRSQSAFLVARNKKESGAYAGFGLFYSFPREWALPANPSDWRQYRFAFDFREAAGHACILELQLKNENTTNEAGMVTQHGIHFTKAYTPDANGWDTISATLDQFVQHPGL